MATMHVKLTRSYLFSIRFGPKKQHRPAVSRTAVFAEDVDYEAQFTKMQKEAEERLDDKVEELMKNIETVGQN